MPKVFDKILCPVAFDGYSDEAIKFAYELVEPDTSTLYLLHVVSVPTLDNIVLEPNPILSEGIADRELNKLARQHLPPNFPYRILLRTGDPASSILAVAEELPADLIVMPARGYRGITHMIIGSVAEQVVREAKRPVLTIRGDRRTSVAKASKPVFIPITQGAPKC